jgi:subtilisin family serine protease
VRRALAAVAAAVTIGFAATPAFAAPGPPGHTEWWFDTWHVPALWAGGARGQGVTIGEIDTGVNAALPELAGSVLPGDDFGADGGDGRTDRDADFGHGTAMASLMVSTPSPDGITGLAPDAKILPVSVPIQGTTDLPADDQSSDHLDDAMRWAADHGAKVITMSLGRRFGGGGRACTADEQAAVDYALGKGAIVVAAGGNAGDQGSPIEDPGVCVGVLAVGAVDVHNQVPVWSSRHPYLSVTAPGVNVPSLGKVPGQAYYGDGTSQATAITAAGLAVIWSKYPALTNWQVEARLLATLDGARPTRDPATGYGMVDIGAAVTASVPASAPNPLFDAVNPFLQRDRDLVAAPAKDPRPATARTAFPGAVRVVSPPGPLAAGPGLVGTVVGAVGLAVVVALGIGTAVTVRGRRRARRSLPE